jgi:hypothetical protein
MQASMVPILYQVPAFDAFDDFNDFAKSINYEKSRTWLNPDVRGVANGSPQFLTPRMKTILRR